jgi:hypothetical protein
MHLAPFAPPSITSMSRTRGAWVHGYRSLVGHRVTPPRMGIGLRHRKGSGPTVLWPLFGGLFKAEKCESNTPFARRPGGIRPPELGYFGSSAIWLFTRWPGVSQIPSEHRARCRRAGCAAARGSSWWTCEPISTSASLVRTADAPSNVKLASLSNTNVKLASRWAAA